MTLVNVNILRLKYEGVVSPISKSEDKSSNSDYKPFDPSAAYDALTELPNFRYDYPD